MFVVCKQCGFKHYSDFLLKDPRVETVVWLGFAKFVGFSKHSVLPERLRNTELHDCGTKNVTEQQIMTIKFLLVYQIFSFTLRGERRLRVVENGVLRKIVGPKREEVSGGGKNYIMRSLIISTAHQIFFGRSNREE